MLDVRRNRGKATVVLLGLVRTMAVIAIVFAFCVITARAESNIEKAGDLTQVVIPLAAGLSTLVVDDSQGTGQFCKSYVATFGITYALKYLVNKDRPEGHGAHSFPSGHTTAAFQGAAFTERRYGWVYGMPCYLAAAFVGWSRIESDKHDAIDVLAGAAIGILMSYSFTSAYKVVAVVPTVESGAYGICIRTRW